MNRKQRRARRRIRRPEGVSSTGYVHNQHAVRVLRRFKARR